MNIVYIAGRFSHCDRNDLRYSLRSLDRYGEGIDKVFVIGDKVKWLSDEVGNIVFEQPFPSANGFTEKHINLQETLRYIAHNVDTGDEFIYSSDDHYLTKGINFSKYPYYMKLTNTGCELPFTSSTDYNAALVSTRKFLTEHNLPTKYMTLHRNMRLCKDAIIACEQYFDEILEKKLSVEPFALIGNYMIKEYGIVPVPAKDYKITKGSEWWKSDPHITDIYSTSELHYGGLSALLGGEYSIKCKYEK